MKNNSTSSFFTLLSIVLVLCLLGIYGIITLHTSNLVDILKENMNLIVELEDSVSKESQLRIVDELKARKQIKAESVLFKPKENAIAVMGDELGEKFLLNESDNPFLDVISFNVEHEYVDEDELKSLAESIELDESVHSVSYFSSVYDYLKSNVRKLMLVLLIIGLVLSIFAFALIYSTIQLNLYSERFKIRTMELVGASWTQIRKPFLIRSIRLAIVSSLISIVILMILLIITAFQFEYFWSILNVSYILLIFIAISLFSLLITQAASYVVLNKYLGSNASNIY